MSARAGGERLVARIRVVVLAMLLPIQMVPGSSYQERAVGMATTALGLAIALGLWALAERGYRPWLGVVSSALDVSLISLALAAHWVLGNPVVTMNSRTTFEVYFLALFCAALRFDWRICVFTGVLAVVQYLSLVVGAALSQGVHAGDIPDPRYGVFSWNIQAVRVVLLLAATVAATAAVFRTRGLRQLSTTDRLTGLLNRGAFDERLIEEASRSRRHGRPFALAIVDIDRFKAFNDSHGHLAGDAALVAVADTLRHSVRQSDLVARYGGEEFVLILPETRAVDAVPPRGDPRRVRRAAPRRRSRHRLGHGQHRARELARRRGRARPGAGRGRPPAVRGEAGGPQSAGRSPRDGRPGRVITSWLP